MQITFDPDEEPIERLIETIKALYKVDIYLPGPEDKMRH
jgi:hypothetical protein